MRLTPGKLLFPFQRLLPMNDEYDVVVHALEEFRDRLQKMTNQNMEMGMFNILDQIRLEQIAELDEAIKERKNGCN